MNLIVGCLLILGSLSTFQQTRADDALAQAKLTQARELYGKRENLENVNKAMTLLSQALKEAQSSDLKYDIVIAHATAQYFKGTRTTGTDEVKLAEFEKAYNLANSAKAYNDDYAEAYYYYGISLARWAEVKGVVASLSRKKELMDNMNGAIERDTREGKSGDTIDSYGPDRVLGRMYYKLPGFAGGSMEKSIRHLTRAYANGKTNALNVVYFAETMLNGNTDQKASGCRALNDLLKQDPRTYNPERVPETIEEFRLASELKQKYKNDCGR